MDDQNNNLVKTNKVLIHNLLLKMNVYFVDTSAKKKIKETLQDGDHFTNFQKIIKQINR